jgi:hypothetical protein
MHKKCDTCRHRTESELGLLGTAIRCANKSVIALAYDTQMPVADMPLTYARQICDREADGHFVYFEPRDPEAGASFTENKAPQLSDISNSRSQIAESSDLFVHITRERVRRAAA